MLKYANISNVVIPVKGALDGVRRLECDVLHARLVELGVGVPVGSFGPEHAADVTVLAAHLAVYDLDLTERTAGQVAFLVLHRELDGRAQVAARWYGHVEVVRVERCSIRAMVISER